MPAIVVVRSVRAWLVRLHWVGGDGVDERYAALLRLDHLRHGALQWAFTVDAHHLDQFGLRDDLRLDSDSRGQLKLTRPFRYALGHRGHLALLTVARLKVAFHYFDRIKIADFT